MEPATYDNIMSEFTDIKETIEENNEKLDLIMKHLNIEQEDQDKEDTENKEDDEDDDF